MPPHPLTVPLLAPIAAFALTFVVLGLAIRSDALVQWMADRPNERSLHRRTTPRFGGLGILVGALTVALVTGLAPSLAALLLAYAVLAVVSAVDDRQGLPASVRLVVHLGTAWAFAATTGIGLPWGIPVVLAMVWATNLFNFMDGADGLAGGMAAIGLLTLGLAAWVAGTADGRLIAQACFVLGACVVAFLCFNFPPARLFLGDAGSIPLGFTAAAVGLQGAVSGLWSPLFPLMVFFPFVFDATLTLARRTLAGRPPWQAHREHLYQKAVLAGLSHRRMTLRAYGLIVACAALAWSSRNFPIAVQSLIIAFQSALGFFLAARITRQLVIKGQD